MSKVEITLQDILWALRKYLVWIVLTTIVFGVGSWFYTKNYVQPTYHTSMSFAIRASSRVNGALTAGEQTADARLASLCCELLKSDRIAREVSTELNGFVPAIAVKGMITAYAGKDSPVINIRLNGGSPDSVYRVARAIEKVAPQVIPELAGAGELNLINEPIRPNFPISPNLKQDVTLGILAGLALSIAVVVLIAILDTTIWREEDLERAFDIPVLGTVPSMSATAQHTSTKRRNS